jgi:thiamine biosynthesis lipoprotein
MESNTVVEPPSIFQKRTTRLMGNLFTIGVVSEDETYADRCINAAVSEIQLIEKLLTTFDDSSQTNQVNREAGIRPVAVDREVFDLIERSTRISQLTQGAFDITYGSIDKSLWNFDKNMTSLPDAATAKRMVRLIDYRNIILNSDRGEVMLKHKGMRIGFGGIGKGYAADRARQILVDMGVMNGVVNASGDLTVWGARADGKPWTIGIADPNTKHPFSYLPLTNLSVATSGNYEKFVVINGKRYSHTIDPKTGLPARGIKSVTIISPLAELSDAMATPVTVMGVKAGLDMINQMKGVACIIIDDNDQLYTSSNISIDKKRK